MSSGVRTFLILAGMLIVIAVAARAYKARVELQVVCSARGGVVVETIGRTSACVQEIR